MQVIRRHVSCAAEVAPRTAQNLAANATTSAIAPPAGRAAVLSLTLCVMVLIASEFMPVSLLTPIAGDLGITEGRAGQAIAISGVFAVITSLIIASATARRDRRTVLLALTLVTIASGVCVTAAPNYAVFMLGRALLGVAIGGFWSLSTATIMRLVPPDRVPGALATLNGGNALAATVAAPLGSFAGSVFGWRGAFFCVVPLAVATLVWQFVSLPALPPTAPPSSANVFGLLRRPSVAVGMGAILLLFMGQFALFTYLRPFLETVTQVDVKTLSLLLLCIGVAGLVGNMLIGRLLAARLGRVLALIPAAMAAIALALVALGGHVWPVAALLIVWGLVSTPAPVGWGTWLTRTLPDDADAGGGLMVATIQLAITLGAALGGVAFDTSGHQSTFALSALVLVAGAVLAVIADSDLARGSVTRRLTALRRDVGSFASSDTRHLGSQEGNHA